MLAHSSQHHSQISQSYNRGVEQGLGLPIGEKFGVSMVVLALVAWFVWRTVLKATSAIARAARAGRDN